MNYSYTSKRKDVLDMIPKTAVTILDIGCSTGNLGKSIKERQKYKHIKVVGVELNKQLAEEARDKLDKIIVANLDEISLSNSFQENFDCIIFADVLEHVEDPWRILKEATSLLSDKGTVILSLPNIQHYTVIKNIIIGYWPYRDRGIFDRTHIRQFTLKNIKELASGAGLTINNIERNYRIIDRPHSINNFAKYFALPGIRNYLVYQYILSLSK